MNCREFKEMMDSYISDELLVETNHDVLRHLEHCPSCREALKAQRLLRSRLRSAVRRAPDAQVNPAFAARLRASLREHSGRSGWREKFAAYNIFVKGRTAFTAVALAGLIVVFGLGAFWLKFQTTSLDKTAVAENQSSNSSSAANNSPADAPFSQSPVAQAVQIAWREIIHSAVGDHRDCALEFKLEEKPITLAEASKKYGKYNENLNRVIIEPLREVFPANSSGEIKLLAAHSCLFRGRRFAHVVLRRRSQTISVLVTDADLPNGAGEEIITETSGNLQIAGFRTKRHAVFVVSDLPAAENLFVAQTIVAPVRQHLKLSETNSI